MLRGQVIRAAALERARQLARLAREFRLHKQRRGRIDASTAGAPVASAAPDPAAGAWISAATGDAPAASSWPARATCYPRPALARGHETVAFPLAGRAGQLVRVVGRGLAVLDEAQRSPRGIVAVIEGPGRHHGGNRGLGGVGDLGLARTVGAAAETRLGQGFVSNGAGTAVAIDQGGLSILEGRALGSVDAVDDRLAEILLGRSAGIAAGGLSGHGKARPVPVEPVRDLQEVGSIGRAPRLLASSAGRAQSWRRPVRGAVAVAGSHVQGHLDGCPVRHGAPLPPRVSSLIDHGVAAPVGTASAIQGDDRAWTSAHVVARRAQIPTAGAPEDREAAPDSAPAARRLTAKGWEAHGARLVIIRDDRLSY